MRLIGREAELEKQNMEALRIARQVADDTGTLMAGNLCNTTVYVPDDPATHKIVAEGFKVILIKLNIICGGILGYV